MRNKLFEEFGAHVLVDGQYGSTGKGVLAAWLALQAVQQKITVDAVISNAGPNSGHTFYNESGQKVVLKQLPTFAVATADLLGVGPLIYLSAGAIIDPEILRKEAENYPGEIIVHPNAAVITAEDKASEHSGTVAAVAGTRSGTGAALARKVLRDPNATYGAYSFSHGTPRNVHVSHHSLNWDSELYFVEVSQGFSLGINQQFYPKCTSRECTVSQALSDAGLPPNAHSKTYMSVRTFPIRVGNVDGHSSGEWYPDQIEVSWEDLGQTPELTTVTQRVRRIATFSNEQLEDAVQANSPDFLFVNFMNYLPENEREPFIDSISDVRDHSYRWFDIIRGSGPTSNDVIVDG